MIFQQQPIILIGIGTSGLYILEQVQNFYYENTGVNRPSHVAYLYLETNRDNKPRITALTNEIKRVYISLASMQTMIQELREQYGDDMHWLPPEDHVLEAGMGAGGIPACGRLSLWGRNKEGHNLENVIHAISRAFNSVSGPNAQGSTNAEPTVFITGSLTGGTGSGVFIDIAYLVRNIIPGIKDLYSLLLLPPQPHIIAEKEVIYCNAYGAIKALAHYNTAQHQYVTPNNTNRVFKDLPFELSQFISQSYNDSTPQISSLAGLYKIAGLYLFLNAIGLRAKRRERLIDAKGNMQIGKYGTFGLSAIQYPKSQIQEYLSLKLGTELLERWIDPSAFYSNQERVPIDKSSITRQVKKSFTKFLREAFENLNASNSYNVPQNIRKEVVAINRGEKNDPGRRLYELFSNANLEGYYSFVKNNLQSGVDSLIRSIAGMVVNDFNNFESLYYAREQLLSIADIIKSTLDYWRSLGISSFPAKWGHFLDSQIKWATGNNFKWLMEHNNVLEDKMLTIFDQLKMHLFVKKLIEIRKNILEGENPMATSDPNDRIELPTILGILQVTRSIEFAIGQRDTDTRDNRFKGLRKRQLEITADVEDETIPILRIFHADSFASEVAQSHERYRHISGKNLPSKTILIGEKGLWDYLSDQSEPLHRKLYYDCILKFRQELESNKVVLDYDVSKYVKKHPQMAKKYASKSIAYLLPIRNKTLRRSQNIPKVVMGSDRKVISDVIKSLQEESFYEFNLDGDHIKEISELKNIMVFYIEQGNFEPLEDIDYIEEVKKVDVSYPNSVRGMTPDKWFNFRNPYLNNKPHSITKSQKQS